MAPVLPEFLFNPFIGFPVDYIIFNGLTEVADEKSREIRMVFMDMKKRCRGTHGNTAGDKKGSRGEGGFMADNEDSRLKKYP